MEFENLLENRFACRGFENKEIEADKIQAILEAANSAPSAGNLQAYHIFAVSDKKKKALLAKASFEQRFIAKAPLVLVFCANPLKSAAKYGEKGKNLYAIQDATIAAVFAWLEAVDLGLAACWVGGFDAEEAKRALAEVRNLQPIILMPLGYAKEKKKARKREKIEKHLTLL